MKNIVLKLNEEEFKIIIVSLVDYSVMTRNEDNVPLETKLAGEAAKELVDKLLFYKRQLEDRDYE